MTFLLAWSWSRSTVPRGTGASVMAVVFVVGTVIR